MIQGKVSIAYLDPGKWSACFGMCLRDLYVQDAFTKQRIVYSGAMELRAQAGPGGISDARNHLTDQFLTNGNAEWLMFIDTDMGFDRESINMLVESADPDERPIMGGLCFQLYQKETPSAFYGNRYGIMPTLYEYMGGEGFRHIPDYEKDSVVQVDGTGGAFLLIHRSVLEQVQNKCGKQWFSILPKYSEDLSFCRRVAGLGIPIHVNTAVKTTHDKYALFLDEELYNQSRPWASDPLEE